MSATETQNPQATKASSKTSSSEYLAQRDAEAQEADFLRTALGKAGVQGVTRMSLAELRAAEERHKDLRREELILAKEKREAEAKDTATESVLEGLRLGLKNYGVDPAGMSQIQMRQKLDELDRERESQRHQRKADRRAETIRRQAEILFHKSNCPRRHASDLSAIEESHTPKWRQWRDTCVEQTEYAKGFLVVLLGKRGVGKTQLAASVIRKCCDRLFTCRYVKALDLFREFRSAYVQPGKGEKGVRETDVVAEWAEYDLLVIDECHQRGETPHEQNTLINLLDRRYDDNKCTIVIANQTAGEFAAALGDSVVSRIHQTGEAVVCDWPSFRPAQSGGWHQAEGAEKRIPSGTPFTYGEKAEDEQ